MGRGELENLKQKVNEIEKPQTNACEPCRESARGLIQNKIRRLREEADGLEMLLDALPVKLPREADEALWREFCRNPLWR